jgi:hypothetical protein
MMAPTGTSTASASTTTTRRLISRLTLLLLGMLMARLLLLLVLSTTNFTPCSSTSPSSPPNIVAAPTATNTATTTATAAATACVANTTTAIAAAARAAGLRGEAVVQLLQPCGVGFGQHFMPQHLHVGLVVKRALRQMVDEQGRKPFQVTRQQTLEQTRHFRGKLALHFRQLFVGVQLPLRVLVPPQQPQKHVTTVLPVAVAPALLCGPKVVPRVGLFPKRQH